MSHPDFNLFHADVLDFVFPSCYDIVYNLASPASPIAYKKDPIRCMETNVIGTLNLLKQVKSMGSVFVQASTSEVYGDPEVHPQPETYTGNVSLASTRACYDEGKRCAETLCYDFQRMGVDARVARLFNTYGPRMQLDDGRVIPAFIDSVLNTGIVIINGTGSQTRCFNYVTDTVRGLRMLGEYKGPGAHQAFNIGNDHEMTVFQLAKHFASYCDTMPVFEFRPGTDCDPQRRRPDLSRAKSLLGYEPLVGLNSGIYDTLSWFRSRKRNNEGD